MGPVGWQEMTFIFLLALLLFGPKKLPELGRMLGKAMTEFRRAQNELKSTWEREMRNLEQENRELKEITRSYTPDPYNYDYSSYDSAPYTPYGSSPEAPEPASNSTTSASAIEGAVAHGTEPAAAPAEPESPPADGSPPGAPVARSV
jgi:TatA/E family protein of Tat protein translocase